MDGSKKVNSSSSITAQLFGHKESPPSSSADIFASIFPPPPKVVGGHTGSEAKNTSQKVGTSVAGAYDDRNGNNSNTASRGNWWQGSLYY